MFILGEIMKEKHFTSKMLSEVTGIPKQTIDAYRSNFRRKEPSFSNGLKIADALGIDPHELFSTQYTDAIRQAKKNFLNDGIFYVSELLGETEVFSKETVESLRLQTEYLEKWEYDGEQWIKTEKAE